MTSEMDPEAFRAAAHELVDWIADHRARVPGLPVAAPVLPGEVATALGDRLPGGPVAFAEVLADLDTTIAPGITQVGHPSHFGWFPSNSALSSVLGDIAASGLGALGISWQSAPALTEVEQVVVAWLREETGLSDAWHGTIHDTASTACLVALLLGRERASEMSKARGGLQAAKAPLTVYCSPQAHSSVEKAALLAGFGADNIRQVAVDPATYAMVPSDLARLLAEDAAGGARPAVVVASVGTTATTAMDPVADIVEVARTSGAWVHVDAAMAGSAMLLPEKRHLFEGVEGADSLSWNPHKWLGTILDCSLFYVRDFGHLNRVMSTDPSYLRSAVDGQVVQYRDWGIPLGRRFRALKLWFQLRLDGLDAIRDRLRRDLENAAWLADQVAAEHPWVVLTPVSLQTVCLRHEPAGLAGDELDRHTLAWVDRVNSSGQAFLTPAVLDGRWMARISIGSMATERTHVSELWRLMRTVVVE
ncbi:MAG: pyridoxal phosphate-dependent decarboxylase family protein [Nocardioides sp.]